MGSKTFALQTARSCRAVTTGNTMASCIIIGERAAEILREEHKL
jgi:hypothetical protein